MIPFLPRPGVPSYWFRTDPAEVEQHRRMVAALERLLRAADSAGLALKEQSVTVAVAPGESD